MIKGLLAATVVVILIAIPLFLFLSSSHSSLAFVSPPQAIGAATPLTVNIQNSHGTRHISARIEQNSTSKTLAEANQPANRFTFWRVHAPPQRFNFSAGKIADLKEGKARVVVEAESNDLRGSVDAT